MNKNIIIVILSLSVCNVSWAMKKTTEQEKKQEQDRVIYNIIAKSGYRHSGDTKNSFPIDGIFTTEFEPKKQNQQPKPAKL
ncbi:MAG TPA: hypothetical protein VLB80_04925 [Candidatus Babeliales bacterium]|nr:hypothetical protein [Candidatus Babeliales bacterium]